MGLRLVYLGVTNAFAMLRLLPASDRSKDIEILTLRHQIMVLQRQLGEQRLMSASVNRDSDNLLTTKHVACGVNRPGEPPETPGRFRGVRIADSWAETPRRQALRHVPDGQQADHLQLEALEQVGGRVSYRWRRPLHWRLGLNRTTEQA